MAIHVRAMTHSGTSNSESNALLNTKISIHTLINIMDDDMRTPNTKGFRFFVFLESQASDEVRAVLETIHPMNHVSQIHFFVPTILVKMYQTNHIQETNTTINRILYGLKIPRNQKS